MFYRRAVFFFFFLSKNQVMCKNTCIVCSETAIVKATENQNPLPNNIFSGKAIKGLWIRRNTSGNAKSLSGKTLVNDAVLESSHLVLEDSAGTKIGSFPLQMFVMGDCCDYFCLSAMISESKSYIKCDTSAAGYDADHVFEIVFIIADGDCKVCIPK
jgi:hypothetical protein